MFNRKKIKSLFVIALVFTLLAGLPNAFAAQVSDIDGHWAEETIEQWLEKEWISGYSDGTFRPNGETTRAEITVLVNQAFEFTNATTPRFSDVNQENWFYEQVGIAVEAGYISGYPDETFKPNDSMTRQEFAVILNALLDLPAGSEADLPADGQAAPDWSRQSIANVYNVGLITGYQDGTFRPQAETTRAEVVVMLQRALPFISADTPIETVDPLDTGMIDTAGYYGGTPSSKRIVDHDLTIDVAGVTLQNVIVKGDLLLGEGIGEGDVTLKNVTVEGTTTVAGGENSIYIENSSLGLLIIDKATGNVRVVVQGTTTVEVIEFQSGGKLEAADLNGSIEQVLLSKELPEGADVQLVGAYESVTVESSGVTLTITQGTITELVVAEDADDVSINLGANVVVNKLVVNAKATITGEGKVSEAEINVDDVTVDVDVDRTTGEADPSPDPGTSPSPSPSPGPGVSPGPGQSPGVPSNHASIQSMSVTVGEAVYESTRVGGKYSFVIPTDIDESALITEFVINATSNAKSLTIGMRTVDFKDGVAEAKVTDMLGDLEPTGDGLTVKELIEYLLANDITVLEVEGILVNDSGRSRTYRFELNATDYIAQLPTVSSIELTVGGKNYAAEKVSDTEFKFVIPEDVEDTDKITAFKITGGNGAATVSATVSAGDYEVAFEDGVATALVSEILGDLDSGGDGVSVGLVKQELEAQTVSNIITVTGAGGSTQSFIIQLEDK